MLIEHLEPNFTFTDERGSLTQLVREGFHQVNVIESKAGALRGAHYHKLNREAFFVIHGRFLLVVCKDGERENYLFSDREMFVIPPYVNHSFSFQTDTLLVSLYDRGVEMLDGGKDIFNLE